MKYGFIYHATPIFKRYFPKKSRKKPSVSFHCLFIVLQFHDFFKDFKEFFQKKTEVVKIYEKSLTKAKLYATIMSLNRGADEHQYPPRAKKTVLQQNVAVGKGYLRRSAFIVLLALGIRENTRMTVTVL